MTTIIMTVVVVIIAIGTIAFVMLAAQPNVPGSSNGTSASRTTTSSGTSSTSSGTSTTNSSAQAYDLKLAESVNASTITVGQRVNISVSLFNTRPSVNSILPASDWNFNGIPIALWPPCYFGLPAEMVVLNGNYTLQDLHEIANMSFGYECMEGISIDHVIFEPSSDRANLTGAYTVTNSEQTAGPFLMAFSFTTAGYWNLSDLSSKLNSPILGESGSAPPAYNAFTPGIYTIAVDDEWGEAVVVHITVITAPSGSSSSMMNSNSSSTVTSSSSSSSISVSSTVSSTTTVLVPQSTTYQVQSSYDCVAGHSAQPFNVTTATLRLEGGISATQPGVTLYIATTKDAQTIVQGHPAVWLYSSGLTNSTSFSLLLAPGSYVLWTEGADLRCGASIVTPLEQMTTVTVTQSITLTPA